VNIVLDTNIIFRNWHLTGPTIDLLRASVQLGHCRLFVPQIVFEEAEANFRDRVQQHLRQVGRLRGLITPLDLHVPAPPIGHIVEVYSARLRQRLGEIGAESPTYTDVPLSDIVQRCNLRRKPFGAKSDKGFKDTLLWETLLRHVVTTEQVTHLITDNHKDFAADHSGSELHSDLVDDLDRRHYSSQSVRLHKDLATFVRQEVVPLLRLARTDIVDAIRRNQYRGFSFIEWCAQNTEAIKDATEPHLESLLARYHEFETPTPAYLNAPDQVEIIEAIVLEGDEDRVFVSFTARCEMGIDAFVFRADIYNIEDDYPLEVCDYEWNEHYAWVQLTTEVEVNISVTFNIPESAGKELEVTGFNEFFGWCRKCGATIFSDAAEECPSCGWSFS